jgi:mono/diheme cytochrome c family protein
MNPGDRFLAVFRRLIKAMPVGVVLLLAAATAPAEEKSDFFVRNVRPLLAEKCWACHGDDAKQIKGELNLKSRAAALKGGASGEPSIVAGEPARSPLFLAATRTSDNWSAMPPKETDQLTPAQLEILRTWIADGAVWSDAKASAEDSDAGVTVRTSGGLSADWTNRKYRPENLWAYQPLRRPEVPDVGTEHPVDAFVNARLKSLGLEPAPLADRRTLIRRATFDLIGLPPTPREVADFLNDPRPDEAAFADVIERLLKSPHYGEQWGRHWLDVVRYADSAGFANDYERGSAWRYRDYVVRAFNQDKPYDRFIVEQIAGDELTDEPLNSELLIATGFLRMGPWELTGMEVAKIARQRFLDDVTDSVGQVFLAHALQCARCHDHKFDPVPTRDYYSIQACFATTQIAEREAPFLPDENVSGFEERKYLDARAARYQQQLQEINAKQEAAGRAWAEARGLEFVSRSEGLRRGIPEDKLPPQRIGLDALDLGRERIARKGLERLGWEYERYKPHALAVYSGRTPNIKSVTSPPRMPQQPMTTGELEVTCILSGGDPFSPRDPVTPGFLSAVVLRGAEVGGQGAEKSKPEIVGRRRELARWIASPENPLTARVMVNRLWLWHFGQAIAGNPNNFGATGKKPTHPELLDWLASEFIARDWSIKSMHRLLMSSETYRRTSRHPDPATVEQLDPLRTSYARFQPRRLAAEELRDAILSVTGEINLAVGGIPVRPEINPEVAWQPRQVMGTFAPAWQPSPRPEQRHRRSLYSLKLRGLRDPAMEVFNQPSPDLSCEFRETSTVTPQVFALFNSQWSQNRAVALALRLTKETTTREAAIDRAFALAFSRKPNPDERAACLQHWQKLAAQPAVTTAAVTELPREVVRDAVDEITGERFQFVEVLDVAADFVPDRTLADLDANTQALADVCLVLLNANEFLTLD